MKRIGSLYDQPKFTDTSDKPKFFEQYEQNQGYINYKADISKFTGKQTLKFHYLRDFATVFLDGKKIVEFDDLNQGYDSWKVDIDLTGSKGQLEVLVDGWGHKGYGMDMETDRKGIIDNVYLNDVEVTGWTMDRYVIADNFTEIMNAQDTMPERDGGVFKGTFNLDKTDDTWIEFKNYTKGFVFVNGMNIGRYWNVGP